VYANGLCLVYFTSFNKQLLHLVYNNVLIVLYAEMGKTWKKKQHEVTAWLTDLLSLSMGAGMQPVYAEHLATKPQGLEETDL
jgi:hypothetical protein